MRAVDPPHTDSEIVLFSVSFMHICVTSYCYTTSLAEIANLRLIRKNVIVVHGLAAIRKITLAIRAGGTKIHTRCAAPS